MHPESARGRFDPLTVTFGHPDATVAILSGGEINSHFSVPPYQYHELKTPGVHVVLNSTEVMGGPATITVILGTVKFHDAIAKTIAAIYAALGEAMAFTSQNKRLAADIHLKATKENFALDELTAMLEMPGFIFTTAPNGTLQYAEQLFTTGVIKTKPLSWKDVFFAAAHGLPGT